MFFNEEIRSRMTSKKSTESEEERKKKVSEEING